MPHAKKLTTAAIIGALLPFLLGADGSPVITGDESLAVLALKFVIAALSPAVVVAVGVLLKALGAGLLAAGKRLLGDKNPANDALGAGLAASGKQLLAKKEPA